MENLTAKNVENEAPAKSDESQRWFLKENINDRNSSIFKNELLSFELSLSKPNHTHTLLSNCKNGLGAQMKCSVFSYGFKSKLIKLINHISS